MGRKHGTDKKNISQFMHKDMLYKINSDKLK